MKSVLDDHRNISDNRSYNLVRTYDILVYMKEYGIDVNHINIHSDHILGVPKIREYAWENFPNSSITFNPL